MKPSEILKKGLDILETKGWTQGMYARDASGLSVDDLEDATCACGIGAIRLAAFNTVSFEYNPQTYAPYGQASDLLNEVCEDWWMKWQDKPNRTFAEVKAKFQEAIDLAEAEEAQ